MGPPTHGAHGCFHCTDAVIAGYVHVRSFYCADYYNRLCVHSRFPSRWLSAGVMTGYRVLEPLPLMQTEDLSKGVSLSLSQSLSVIPNVKVCNGKRTPPSLSKTYNIK